MTDLKLNYTRYLGIESIFSSWGLGVTGGLGVMGERGGVTRSSGNSPLRFPGISGSCAKKKKNRISFAQFAIISFKNIKHHK